MIQNVFPWMRIFQLAPVLSSVSSQPLEKAEIITSVEEPRREETLQPASCILFVTCDGECVL